MKKFYFILLAILLPMIAFTACSDIEVMRKNKCKKQSRISQKTLIRR